MDSYGFVQQGKKKGGRNRSPVRDRGLSSFEQANLRYQGTTEDYSRAHTSRYGREEHLPADGSHPRGSHNFPSGSTRRRDYDQYGASTNARDVARGAYQHHLGAVQEEYSALSNDQKSYYGKYTGGLPPDHHERLQPHAKQFKDNSYNNAANRENFLRQHPNGYHSMDDQHKHHRYAQGAYREYEYADGRQKLHDEYRSYANADPRRDRYGRPVADRHYPYE